MFADSSLDKEEEEEEDSIEAALDLLGWAVGKAGRLFSSNYSENDCSNDVSGLCSAEPSSSCTAYSSYSDFEAQQRASSFHICPDGWRPSFVKT